jgi:hypothetical protein
MIINSIKSQKCSRNPDKTDDEDSVWPDLNEQGADIPHNQHELINPITDGELNFQPIHMPLVLEPGAD